MSKRHVLIILLTLSTILFGCKGDTGDQGPVGPPGRDASADTVATTNTFALRFNGGNGYVEIPWSPVLKPSSFTVELWVYVDSLFSPFIPLIASTATDERNTADGFSVKFETGYVMFRAAKSSTIAYTYGASYIPPVQQWIHVAGTFDGSFGRVFINGHQIAQITDSQPIWYGSRGLTFGVGYHTNFGGYSFFKGMMDEMRVWNYARDSSSIQQAMKTQLRGDEPGLVGYWNFDISGPSYFAVDASKYNNHGLLWGDTYLVPTTPFR